ncbi:MAG: sigma-70 family RNA polymerase sigma factor [Lachnospiraceae bacterium]|nr:sigma-70 family RNA polymerase sigma factor [Lachnospiraceae bacterium]
MNSDRQAEKLAGKAIRGNVNAYGQLIEYYKEYLYRTAWLLVKNQEDALDIVSDCILRGFHSIRTLKKPEYFRTWMTRILINSARDYRRRYPETEDIDTIYMAEPEQGISPEEKMDLYRAIDLLPEKYRNVVILKYFDEMKISEIAYALEIPEGTVKVYLSRAKTKLRLLLEEDEIYEDEASGYTSSGRTGSGRTGKHEPYLFRAKA